jgi:hypothetical protein
MWPVALAGFLARGAIFALLLPIVVLPTPSGIADVIAPALTSFAFGLVSPAFVEIVVISAAFVAAWVVLGGLVGAWSDVELIRGAAEDEELGGGAIAVAKGHVVLRALAVRLLANIPLGFALAFGAAEIVNAAYAELTTPFEVVTPLFVRVLGDVPGSITLVVAVWSLCEAAGGLAARHVVLRCEPIVPALRDGWLDLVRHPVSSIATLVVTTVALAAVVVAAAVAASAAWSWARFAMLDSEVPAGALAVVVLVAVWLAGLVVVAAVVAWRSVVWTAEALRHEHGGPERGEAVRERVVGTFGGREGARPGG